MLLLQSNVICCTSKYLLLLTCIPHAVNANYDIMCCHRKLVCGAQSGGHHPALLLSCWAVKSQRSDHL